MPRELDLELYRIDVGVVIGKYIGETEKKLDRLFNEAEDSGAMLFIDEADALFRRRSEVKDAHDRNESPFGKVFRESAGNNAWGPKMDI